MSVKQVIRVVMADDHSMFRQGICRMFSLENDIAVVGECSDGEELLRLIDQLAPDVAVIDISMPGPGPVGILDALEASGAQCGALALTMHLEPSYARELMALGMNGYVVKDATFSELTDAVRAVSSGDQYLCSDLVDRAAAEKPLTERELECLRGAAKGGTAKMIARNLGITERTVRFHFSNACRKLGVQRRTAAVSEALRLGLIEL